MKNKRAAFAVYLCAVFSLGAQTQITYTGTNVTGQFVLRRTVNPSQLGANRTLSVGVRTSVEETDPAEPAEPKYFDEMPRALRRLRPEIDREPTAESVKGELTRRLAGGLSTVTGLPITSMPGGFNGLTHNDQLTAANGNQFNSEPPNPGIAVANGYVLLGVNNAIQVYTLAGTPLLPRVIASNELFGVPVAIDRRTGINGVYPTDMRIFHDQTINRWFVVQRAQDYDAAGNTVGSSKLYMAVSQGQDPTAAYNIYVMDTSDLPNPGCPCVADYPSIGADQHGFYIASNEFHSFTETFVNAQIHAVSKASLAAGAVNPITYRIQLPFTTGYEFALQPAITPPGAAYLVASGGVQYFISTQSRATSDNKMAIFALSNTASLGTANPSMTLTQIQVQTFTYTVPDVATQRPGPTPYGTSLRAGLSFIDGGDTRIQGVTYAGGRLFATLATAVNDETGRPVVGGGFAIFSPSFRNGTLAAPVLRQGIFAVRGNHLLRSAIAMNAQGRGAIAATLVGPDHFPSAVYLPIETFSGPTSVRLVQAGAAPQDGFTGYMTGLARWGDYSSPFVTSDGTFWMAVQYIPNLPRSPFANWGTYITRY